MKSIFVKLCAASNFLTNGLDFLSHFALLGVRIYLAKIFLWSAWLKVTSWPSTLFLFKNEFKIMFMSPEIAAVIGTTAEFVFPLFLLLGLGARIPALGLFIFNFISVIFYPQLLTPEYACALKDHVLWGVLAAIPLFFGHGKISIDYLLQKSVCKEYRY